MKPIFLFLGFSALLWAVLLAPSRAQTQADPVLIGTTSEGADGFGAIYQFTPASTTATSSTVTPIVQKLLGNPGAKPYYGQLTPLNGKLYGMTYEGGNTDEGVLFVYDPATDIYTKLKDFSPADGRLPYGSLTVYNNKLYGMTTSGGGGTGLSGGGVIFEFDPATNVYTKKKAFNYSGNLTEGGIPYGSLTLLNNKLYGTTYYGGTNGRGVIFEFDPVTGIYTKKKDFSNADGSYPKYGAMAVYNNKLYGMTSAGGANDSGVIFEFDPATNAYTKHKEFIGSGAGTEDGSVPQASLTLFNNKLYGMNLYDGATGNSGTLFEFDPTTNVFTKKKDMSTIGVWSYGSFAVLGNELVAFGYNQIFSYNPASNIHTIRKNSFPSLEGNTLYGTPLVFNNQIYGMTNSGGSDGQGVLFSLDPTNNAYTVRKNFSGSNGSTPLSGAVYYNGKLYGMTLKGGTNGVGVLYEYDPVTRVYTKKKDFSTADGYSPYGGLLLHNCKLYGLTYYGGTNEGGVLFQFDPATNGYVKLRDFNTYTNNPNGARPYGSLAVWNNKLYGITYNGGTGGFLGTQGNGVIFEYDLTTSTYTKKKDLLPEDGTSFLGRLTLFNNKFYGLMGNGSGVANSRGVLFEYDPATNTYTKKKDIGTADAPGDGASGSLVVLNNKLYGVAASGGLGNGPLFEYDPVTNVYTTRFTFSTSGTNPWRPLGSLVAFRGKLYGQTMNGGLNGNGAVFSFDPALSGPSALSVVFHHKNDVTGFYNVSSATLYTASPQLVVFPDCQLSATATVASVSMCVNDQHAVSVAVLGQNCQPQYAWTADALTRLSNPANTSAISGTAQQSGVRQFSVTITESLCSVSTSTTAMAFDMTSVQNGNWNNPTTWNCGRIPIMLDIVKVRHSVAVPENFTANARQINFETATARLQYGMQARMRLNMP